MSEVIQQQLFEQPSMAHKIALDISVEAAIRPDLLPQRTSVGDFYVGALVAGATEAEAIEASILAADMIRRGEASPSDSYLRLGAFVVLDGRVGNSERLTSTLHNLLNRPATNHDQPTLWGQQ